MPFYWVPLQVEDVKTKESHKQMVFDGCLLEPLKLWAMTEDMRSAHKKVVRLAMAKA